MGFIDQMRRSKTRVVLALDLRGPNLLERALRILDEVHDQVAGVKVNRHLSIPLSLNDLAKLVERAHDHGLPTIMDYKVNDIDSTNEVAAELFFNAGFDAITACPFTGWEGGLEPVFRLARRMGKGVILLAYMSHAGASHWYGGLFIDPRTLSIVRPFEVFIRQALAWGADGVVVGATRPNIVEEAARLLKGRALIFSPGVVVQGGVVEEALRAGADYLIVGRAIVESPSPREAAASLNRVVEGAVARMHGWPPKG